MLGYLYFKLMKNSYLLLLVCLAIACSKEEPEPEVVVPEPTTFIEKYDNTVWDNGTDTRIGFANDTTRFLWTVPLVGDCVFLSDGLTYEADGGVYNLSIERNIPTELVYVLSFTREENTANFTYVYTEENDVLNQEVTLYVNNEPEGDPIVIEYNRLTGTLISYCN